MANTIFYREVPQSVKGAISARKSTYSNTGVRTSDDHTWLYKKSSWVSATAYPDPERIKEYDTVRSAKSITIPSGGFEKLYTRSPETGYTPPPNITSVKLYNTADFGSVQRCELVFTVYNLAQLNEHQPFFDIGSRLKVEFGWSSTAITYYNGNVTFDGIIINFTFSVNPDGSFACTTTALSEGVNVLNVQSDSRSYTQADAASTADTANSEITVSSLIGKLRGLKNILKTETFNTRYGIGKLAIKNDFTDNTDPQTPALSYYMTLLSFISQVNTILDGNKTNPVKIVTTLGSEKFALGKVPKKKNYLVSGDPRIIIFPGYGNYNEKDYGFTNESISTRFAAGELDSIMINIDWVLKQISGQEKLTVGNLFDLIFKQINTCSGKRYTLTLAQYPTNSKLLVVTDPNYFDEKIIPLELTAVTNGSVCRNISLSAKVPGAMATQAYFGNNNSGNVRVGSSTAILGKDKQDIPNTDAITKNLEDLINKVASIDFSTMTLPDTDINTIFTELQTALAEVYFNIDTEISQNGRLIPFPVDFTATLDGINGFEFGHTITCNYLPAVYKQANNRIVFTVSKVEHNVSNNDWTTTLSTICRIAPQTTN